MIASGKPCRNTGASSEGLRRGPRKLSTMMRGEDRACGNLSACVKEFRVSTSIDTSKKVESSAALSTSIDTSKKVESSAALSADQFLRKLICLPEYPNK